MLLRSKGLLTFRDRSQLPITRDHVDFCKAGQSFQVVFPSAAHHRLHGRNSGSGLCPARERLFASFSCRAEGVGGNSSSGSSEGDGPQESNILKDSQSWRSFRAQLVALEQRQLQSISIKRPGTNDAGSNASHWVHQIACPEVGSLLIARHPDLGIFTRTVILIIAHERNPHRETVGLILNLPTRLLIEDETPETLKKDEQRHSAHKLWMGGPCSPNFLFALHTCAELGDAEPIIEGIFQIQDTLSTVAAMNKGLLPPEKVRFFSGYSGWAAGQLAFEVEVGTWWVAAASSSLIQECLQGVGWQQDGSNESDGMWHRFRRLLDVQEPDSPAPGMGDFQP